MTYTLREPNEGKVYFPALDKYIEEKKAEITAHLNKEIQKIKTNSDNLIKFGYEWSEMVTKDIEKKTDEEIQRIIKSCKL